VKLDEDDKKPEEIYCGITEIEKEKNQPTCIIDTVPSKSNKNDFENKKSNKNVLDNKQRKFNDLEEGEIKYIEPKKPTINVLSKEETIKTLQKMDENKKKKGKKKKETEELDDLQKELADIPDEEANKNKYAAKEIDNSLFEKLKKNPQNSAQIIFESTVKKKQNNSPPNFGNLLRKDVTKTKEKVIPNIDFLKKPVAKRRYEDSSMNNFDFPPFFKMFQKTSKFIEDRLRSTYEITKFDFQNYHRKLEKIFLNNKEMPFHKLCDMFNLINDYDLETTKHLSVLNGLYFMESVKIIVDSSSYYEMKKTIEEESSNNSDYSPERRKNTRYKEKDDYKLHRKRRREKETEKSRAKRKRRRRRSVSSSGSYYSSDRQSRSSRSYSALDKKRNNKRKYKESNKKYDRNNKKRDKAFKKNSYIHYDDKYHRDNRKDSNQFNSNSSLVNLNNSYKNNPKNNTNQANTYIDKVFCGNLVMTNQNTNICKDDKTRINKVDQITKDNTFIAPQVNTILESNNKKLDSKIDSEEKKNTSLPNKTKNYEIQIEGSQEVMQINKLLNNLDKPASKNNPPCKTSSNKLNKKELNNKNKEKITSTKEVNQEKMLQKIREKLSTNNKNNPSTNKTCETIVLCSKSPSIDMSPVNRKASCDGLINKDHNLKSKSKERFYDTDDFVE
jgi:hypothetical protein